MPQTRAQAASAASGDLLSQAQSSTTHIVKKGWDHWLIIGPKTVTTRELRPKEYLLQDGKPVAPYWFAERLRNEFAVAAFLRANTTIPVPPSRLYTDGGLLHLETERVLDGIPLSDFIFTSGKQVRETALRAVDAQLKETILPQLQSLRSNRIGSVDATIPVFPPYRVFQENRRGWHRVTSEKQEFVLCHTSLNEQSIIVDPATYKIVAIVGWECAGYFPPYFELPLWLDTLEASSDVYSEAKARELAFFGLTTADLVNESARKPAI
ncbi:aminoglycoside phosphotransferase [Akanthomyces lecanii RCEF 1005]|uniref:Aminoglycoside phosphotransferase n=1 Tax=Akanthomyces lecanii RCEF 1005 TaxID=1081108 RepID=A0A168HLW9_CORDF|nr:aminoglycoside phosphotransferase [Akanthomyces lecanii RCEF 1005]